MAFSSAEIAAWIGAFFWPLIRVSALFMVAPVFSARMLPRRIRLIITIAFTWAIVPFIPSVPIVDPLSPTGILLVAQQILIGLSMGFTLRLVFGALELGGHMIATQMGLGFASFVDPQSGSQSPLLSQYYVLLGTLIFLSLDGHLLLLRFLVESFIALPVSTAGVTNEVLWTLATWGAQMFAGAILISLPAVVSLLVVNLAFGVMTRAAPQLNILTVGFPIGLIFGLITLLYSLPTLNVQLNHLLAESFQSIHRLLQGQGL